MHGEASGPCLRTTHSSACVLSVCFDLLCIATVCYLMKAGFALCCAVPCCAVPFFEVGPTCVLPCRAVLSHAVLCFAVMCFAVMCCAASFLRILLKFGCSCRQRTPALVQLLGHCNTCLQALLPDQAPTPACYPASSAPADQQPSSDPASLPSVLPAVPDSTAAQAASTLASARDSSTAQAASTSADLQVLLAPGGELKSAKPAHNDHVSESASASTKAREEESLESLRCSVLEGSVGQALAEATREVVLAVLRGCDDTGQPSRICLQV